MCYFIGSGFQTVFSLEQERDMVNYILHMEERLFGLTSYDVRRLAYQLAEKLKLCHNFNHEKCMAGKDWFQAFIKRHPNLALRKAEGTSAARAMGFNKEAVSKFFALYRSVQEKYNFRPADVNNVDETKITIVQKGASKIVALKGKRQVGCKTSAEHGKTVTATICFSASGVYMPPMLIFPRKRQNSVYLIGAPPGAWVEYHPTGWMQTHIFTNWFKRFIEFTNASRENPKLLLLDGHATHVKNLDLIDLAQANGVEILSFPPHCTHKLQLLDVAFMKPLSTYYTEKVNHWLRSHSNCIVTLKEVFPLFGKAFVRAAKVETALHAFQKTGICPLQPDVFTDADFVAAIPMENSLASSRKEVSGII